MRRRTRVSIGASVAGVALALTARSPAFSDAYALANGGFEGGAAGWAPPVGATLAVDASTAPAEGARAAHLTSTGAGQMSLTSQYWESPDATAFTSYSLAALVRDNDAATSAVTARLSILDVDQRVLGQIVSLLGGSDGASYRPITTGSLLAPAGAKYLRVAFSAQASAAGARFSVDGVTITATSPATPIPTPEALPPTPVEPEPPEHIATPTPTPAPRPTSTPRPSATPRVTATPTPAPAPPPGPTLRNANFEQGVAGWSVVRGRLTAAPVIDGLGVSLVLTADDRGTAWVQQTVSIMPGSWSTASALLLPYDGVEAAWLRIAWYVSADGGGAQLSMDDSPAVASAAPNALVQTGRYEVVSTGPMQAPPEAHSARIRVLLRAAGDRGASVLIDDVTFEAAESADAAPPAPAPAARTRAPAGLPTRPAEDAPRLAATSSSPSPATAPSSPPPETRVPGPAARALRITEVMSNPPESGADGDFEWVEVMNSGPTTVDLAGLILSDRRSGSVLPRYTIEPGAVAVIAASGARLHEGTPVVRLPGLIGNSLGNTGDRVALIGADGREIDAVAYGEGAEDGEAAVPAPGPGQSIERLFSPSGVLLDVRVTDTPTPGLPPVPAAARGTKTPGTEPGPTTLTGLGNGVPTWAVLAALAGGLLAGAAATRVIAVVRGRGGNL